MQTSLRIFAALVFFCSVLPIAYAGEDDESEQSQSDTEIPDDMTEEDLMRMVAQQMGIVIIPDPIPVMEAYRQEKKIGMDTLVSPKHDNSAPRQSLKELLGSEGFEEWAALYHLSEHDIVVFQRLADNAQFAADEMAFARDTLARFDDFSNVLRAQFKEAQDNMLGLAMMPGCNGGIMQGMAKKTLNVQKLTVLLFLVIQNELKVLVAA